MATGREVQLTRQIGEYLAAAEFGRRGWIATAFTGSVPGFDILAVNRDCRMLEVQVKAIRSSSFQLNAGHFLEIEHIDGVQFVRGVKAIQSSRRVCIFVVVNGQGEDDFYIFSWEELQQILRTDYKDGPRTRKPETHHHALYPKRIEQFKDNSAAVS